LWTVIGRRQEHQKDTSHRKSRYSDKIKTTTVPVHNAVEVQIIFYPLARHLGVSSVYFFEFRFENFSLTLRTTSLRPLKITGSLCARCKGTLARGFSSKLCSGALSSLLAAVDRRRVASSISRLPFLFVCPLLTRKKEEHSFFPRQGLFRYWRTRPPRLYRTMMSPNGKAYSGVDDPLDLSMEDMHHNDHGEEGITGERYG
jgi:hypothetical protein